MKGSWSHFFVGLVSRQVACVFLLTGCERTSEDNQKTAVQYLRGEKVEKRIDTGVIIVTPENMIRPEISELLFLDISEFLGE